MPAQTLLTVKTPCIGVCSTALGGFVCRGCKRFAHEVIDWNGYSHEQKMVIEQRLSGFLTTLVQNKLAIVNQDKLQSYLANQSIRISRQRNLYCQSFELLKVYASQIEELGVLGLQLHSPYAAMSLKALCQLIDEEFYALSSAYYERCFISA